MTTFGRQFDGFSHPRPRGGPRSGAGRSLDDLQRHPEHGPVGSLSAIAREVGVTPSALHMQRRRNRGFPGAIVGGVYSYRAVTDFRDRDDDDDGDGDGGDGGGE